MNVYTFTVLYIDNFFYVYDVFALFLRRVSYNKNSNHFNHS